jgi:DNA (cytosine-5)-methyltransferase 1
MTGPGLIIDLFAGGGGASEAIFMATGRHPDVAVNHDPEAVGQHRANHPHTLHYCEDITQVDPVEVLRHFPGRLVDLLWASPDCTHHSKARGGKPAEKKIRGLAWHVVRWCRAIQRVTGRPPALVALENVEEFQDWGPLGDDDRPLKDRKGEIFRLWVSQLEALGGLVEYDEIVAADFGAPTTRKRLKVIVRFDGAPIVWPAPTHAPAAKAEALGLKPWRPAADILDFGLPCPSIFDRPRPPVPKTRARIAKGLRRYVIEAPRPFIVPITHTGARAVPMVDEPLRTITAAHRGEFSLVAPALARTDMHKSNAGCAYTVEEPLRTITSAGGHAVTAAYLGRQFGSTVSGRSLAEPHPTVVAAGGGGKSQLVAAHLTRQFGRSVGSDASDPMGAVMPGGGGKTQIVAACLDADYATGVPASVTEPLRTATAKARHGLTAAYMAQHNGGAVGHSAAEPLSTITGRGTQQNLVLAGLEPLGGEPRSRRRAVVEFLQEHFGQPTAAERADPLATPGGRLKFGLVILAGLVWAIGDIGMRMLSPRELYGAQGFPPSYIIDRTWDGRPLTKTAQIRMAGNSVSPPPAAALLRANLPDSLLLTRKVA